MEIKEKFNLARVPSILILGVVYVAYVLIGGLVFWKLEGDLGKKDISLLLMNKEKLLSTYTCLDQDGLEEAAQVRKIAKTNRCAVPMLKSHCVDGRSSSHPFCIPLNLTRVSGDLVPIPSTPHQSQGTDKQNHSHIVGQFSIVTKSYEHVFGMWEEG